MRGDDSFVLHVPNGSSSIDVPLSWDSAGQLRRVVQAVSSGLQWLGHYSAFAEMSCGYIEAAVRAIRPEPDTSSWVAQYVYRIDPDVFPGPGQKTPTGRPRSRLTRHGQGRIVAGNESLGLSVELSTPSDLASVLRHRLFRSDLFLHSWGEADLATLKVWRSGGIRDPDHAYALLEAVSRSFSFDIDAQFSEGFELCERPAWPRSFNAEAAERRKERKTVDQPLVLKMNEYSADGLSYYWHARQAQSIPSMEYLNYYQVLEYHFAQYALADTVEFARQRLKDPRFDPANSESLARFVSALGEQLKARSTELPRLRATLARCIAPHSLAEFIESDEELRVHLGKKNTIPGVPQINLGQADLIDRTAERIYGIRNQLVHAKGENRNEGVFILVPGSAEMRHLAQDIKIARFAAQSVLIASSGTFTRARSLD